MGNSPDVLHSKHPFHLNERLILILLSNVSLGVTYACRELLTQAFVPKWPTDMVRTSFQTIAYIIDKRLTIALSSFHDCSSLSRA